MWKNSYRTRTECWQKTSDFPKGKKLPMYLGRQKKKEKTETKEEGQDLPLWERAVKEESLHTLGSPFTGGVGEWRRGEASEPWRRAQPQGCGGQSGEIPAQRIGADQHSPAREACRLTRQGGRGLGAEARASDVGSQGEDCGWLREHSLKGASAPQLAGTESRKVWSCLRGKRLFWPLCFLVHEERGLREPLKGAPETGVSRSYQRRPQRRA